MKTNTILIVPAVGWLLGVVLTALLAARIAPHSPTYWQAGRELEPPGSTFWLGTDHLGRDILSRVITGAQNTLLTATISAVLAVGLGLVMGGVAGVSGLWLDAALMRGIDVLLAFPGLLLALTVITVLGGGRWQSAVAVAVTLVPTTSRFLRAAAIVMRQSAFIEASRALGASHLWVLERHVLRGIIPHAIMFAPVVFSWALISISALEFLGLAASPSEPTWGRMIYEGREFLAQSPMISLVPGFMLASVVLAATVLSDHLSAQFQQKSFGMS